MIYPPSQKPPIWSIDPGVIAYNCQKAGMPHPMLAMPMWEGAGNRVLEYSGRGNHGTFNNDPVWLNDGISFDGTNYITLNSDIVFGHPFDFTISFCAKQDISGAAGMVIGDRTDTGNFCWLYGGNYFRFRNLGSGSSDWTTITDFTIFRQYIISGKGSFVELFINGLPQGSSQPSSDPITINTIGHAYSTGSFKLDGTIKNVTLFNKSLARTQVSKLSNDPYFMYQIPEELYGYTAAAPPVGNPFWYYNMLKRRN